MTYYQLDPWVGVGVQKPLRALKSIPVNKMHIFQCMDKIFCVEFQREPLKFRAKYLTHTLKDMIFIQHWNVKAHKCFWNAPRPVLVSWVNTLRPRQNGRHVADDIFKCIFLNENILIPTKISLNYVPYGLIDNMAALVQIMAWRRPGDKPLSEPMMGKFGDAYMHLSASMS